MTTQSLPQTTVQTQAPTWTLAPSIAVAPCVAVADYQPTSPVEVSSTTSLADLRTLKANWIAQAQDFGDLDALTTIARELGEPFTIPYRNDPAKLLCHGELFILYRHYHKDYMPGRGEFAEYETLLITTGKPIADYLGEKTLVRYTRCLNAPRTDANALFVPGPWLQPLRDLLPQAEQKATARYQAALEADRQALMTELGIPTQQTTNNQLQITNTSPAVPSPIIVQPLQPTNQPASQSTDPFIVDGLEITRLDFYFNDDGTAIVQKLAQTPLSGDRYVVLAQETKPLNLNKTLAFLEKHGYCTREWEAVSTPTFHKPAGMRAWKGDEPIAIRTEGQIRKLRAELNAHAPGLGHAINLAFDL